jgi:hypothetical protein
MMPPRPDHSARAALMNSARAAGSSRSAPSNADVVVCAPRACAPRIVRVAACHGERIGALRAPGGRIGRSQALALAMTTLADLGYEPEIVARRIRLRNCPFDAIVDVAPTLVCAANLSLVHGLLDGLGVTGLTATLVGPCDGCCVAVDAGTRQTAAS